MSLVTLVISAWLTVALLMFVLWMCQYVWHNAGIVDVAWAYATGLSGIYFAFGSESGYWPRRLLVASLAGLWAVRLGWHLTRRLRHAKEDGRYRALRASLGQHLQPFLCIFFQLQALWAVLFALPMWAAVRVPTPTLQWHDWLGLAIGGLAIGGEALADAQLRHFRQDPQYHGEVCQRGLWRYSRHPNYFFEWLHWWAYVCIGWGADAWWITLAGMAVMLLLLLKITGIPPTERQAVRSHGEAYRQYMATTSAFVPLPPYAKRV